MTSGSTIGASGVIVLELSVREAIPRRGARRIGVTPYIESLKEEIRDSLEADEGAEVVAIQGLGISDNIVIERIRGALGVDALPSNLATLEAVYRRFGPDDPGGNRA
jgi:maleate cis-trans isomerase